MAVKSFLEQIRAPSLTEDRYNTPVILSEEQLERVCGAQERINPEIAVIFFNLL